MAKIYTLSEIKDKVKDIFKEKNIDRAILFGSYAKNTATSKSDIDIYIDSNGKIKGFEFFELLADLSEIFNKEIDLIEKYEIITGERMDKEIKETGVLIYGK